MKLIIKDNENDLIISSDWIAVIEIENKRLFSSYVRSLYALVNGRTPEKDISLFEGSVELKISKEVMYVTDPLLVDYNSRVIIVYSIQKMHAFQLNRAHYPVRESRASGQCAS